MIKILFIDYDGTLHDTDGKFASELEGCYGFSSEKIVESYLHVHLNIVHPEYQEKHDDFFFHQKLLCDYLNIAYVENEARIIARKFEKVYEGRWLNPSFFPDTYPFLDAVKEKYILCLTTGDYAKQKAEAIENIAVKIYFSYVFDHTHLGIKGSNHYFKNALVSTNVSPKEAVVIGDSLEQDIAAAKEWGITTIWVNRKQLTLGKDSPAPDFEAHDLYEVLRYLDRL